MRMRKYNLAGIFGLFFAWGGNSISLAQVIVIDSSTRNGSFEEGVLSPWNSGHDVRVLHDPAFASVGDYHATFQSSLIRPVLAVQNLPANPSQGLEFFLSFDARIGTPSLDMVEVRMSARTPEGTSLSAIVTPTLDPALSSEIWQGFEYELEMPAAWNAAGITFSISFAKNTPLDGVPHFAYLDNVVLQQVPEPSAWPLIAGAVCAACLAFRRFRKRRASL